MDDGLDGRINDLLIVLKDSASWSQRAKAVQLLGGMGNVRVVPRLLEALKDEYMTVRKAIANALGELRDKRAVPDLNQMLRYPEERDTPVDAAARSSAARALGRIGDVRSFESLIEALKDPDITVREAAAEALNLFEREVPIVRSIEPLLIVLSDKSERIRVNVIRVLGKLRDIRAVPSLVKALKDEFPEARATAAHVLDHLGWQWKTNDEYADHLVATGVNVGANPRQNPSLASALAIIVRDSKVETELRLKAIRALAVMRAIEILVEALGDPSSWRVRRAAADALDELGWKPTSTPQWVNYLVAIEMRPIDPPVLDALLIEPLIILLSHSHATLRQKAVEGLEKIGDVRALDPIINLLLSDKNIVNKEVVQARAAAVRALGRIGGVQVTPFLVEALRDQQEAVQRVAAETLDQLNWKPTTFEHWISYLIATELKGGHSSPPKPTQFELVLAIFQGAYGPYDQIKSAQILADLADVRALEPMLNCLLVFSRSRDSSACRDLASALTKLLIVSVEEVGLPLLQTLAGQRDLEVDDWETDLSSGNEYLKKQEVSLSSIRYIAQLELERRSHLTGFFSV